MGAFLLGVLISFSFHVGKAASDTTQQVVHFPDMLPGSLEQIAATTLREHGIINGYPDGEFKGNRPVNRAEAAKFLLLSAKIDTGQFTDNDQFFDVLRDQWYAPYVLKAAESNIIDGYPDGFFRPERSVNTAEFLKMMTQAYGITKNIDHAYDDVAFQDWFSPFAGAAEKYDLFPKRSATNLEPSRFLTRNEVAVAIYQYLFAGQERIDESNTDSNTGSTILEDSSKVILDVIPDLNFFISGSSTYNSNTDKYLLRGYDKDGLPQLYVIDTNAGDIETQKPFRELMELQIDLESNSLYGIERVSKIENKNLETDMYFVSLDLSDFTVKRRIFIPSMKAYTGGSSAYNPKTKTYVLLGYEANLVSRLYMIYPQTGQVAVQRSVPPDMRELAIDTESNTLYGLLNQDNSMYFTSFNLGSGVIQKKILIPDLKRYYGGSGVYNIETKKYSVVDNTSASSRLFVIDTNDFSVQQFALSFSVKELHIHPKTGNLYGLVLDKTGKNTFSLVSIHPQNLSSFSSEEIPPEQIWDKNEDGGLDNVFQKSVSFRIKTKDAFFENPHSVILKEGEGITFEFDLPQPYVAERLVHELPSFFTEISSFPLHKNCLHDSHMFRCLQFNHGVVSYSAVVRKNPDKQIVNVETNLFYKKSHRDLGLHRFHNILQVHVK